MLILSNDRLDSYYLVHKNFIWFFANCDSIVYREEFTSFNKFGSEKYGRILVLFSKILRFTA